MQRLISAKPSSVVGLDIRMNEIRFVQLQHRKKQLYIEQADIIKLPPNAIVEGKIRLVEPVMTALRQTMQQFSLQNYPVVIALPIQNVITKKVHITNRLTSKHCEQEIATHISRYFPGMIQELCYDYVVLPAVEKISRAAWLVAARHEQVNDYVNIVERAGFTLKIVDVDIYALLRMIQMGYPNEVLLPWVIIIDIDINSVQCVLLHDGHINYHQQFYYQNDSEMAEKINHIIQHCCAAYYIKQIDKIFFSGLQKMIDQLKNHASIIVNPLQFIAISPSISKEKITMLAEKIMICSGLALRKVPQW